MGMGMPNGAFNTPYGMTYGTPEPYGLYGDSWLYRNMIPMAKPIQQTPQQSPINALLAQSLAAKANAPTLAQLFPSLLSNTGGILGQGQYGAGRFLGNNVIGNPSLTSTAMNVK